MMSHYLFIRVYVVLMADCIVSVGSALNKVGNCRLRHLKLAKEIAISSSQKSLFTRVLNVDLRIINLIINVYCYLRLIHNYKSARPSVRVAPLIIKRGGTRIKRVYQCKGLLKRILTVF